MDVPPLDAPFDLTDRVAIVTGGGTGIGEASARALADHGADVVVTSRKLQNLERVAAEIGSKTGRRCLPIACDVRDEAQVESMVERAHREFGRLDILVNNAGGSPLQHFEEVSIPRWDDIVSLNLRGPFLITRLVGRVMLEARRGAIVNISSGAGVSGVRGGAPYASAKAGLQMFTRVIAAEWGPRGVRANCLAVGAVASPNALRAWGKAGLSAEVMAADAPLGRVAVPEDIAYPVLFLASDASRYVTGVTFAVDGGPRMNGLPEEA